MSHKIWLSTKIPKASTINTITLIGSWIVMNLPS